MVMDIKSKDFVELYIKKLNNLMYSDYNTLSKSIIRGFRIKEDIKERLTESFNLKERNYLIEFEYFQESKIHTIIKKNYRELVYDSAIVDSKDYILEELYKSLSYEILMNSLYLKEAKYMNSFGIELNIVPIGKLISEGYGKN